MKCSEHRHGACGGPTAAAEQTPVHVRVHHENTGPVHRGRVPLGHVGGGRLDGVSVVLRVVVEEAGGDRWVRPVHGPECMVHAVQRADNRGTLGT